MRLGCQSGITLPRESSLPALYRRNVRPDGRSHFRQRIPLRKKPGCNPSTGFEHLGASMRSHGHIVRNYR